MLESPELDGLADLDRVRCDQALLVGNHGSHGDIGRLSRRRFGGTGPVTHGKGQRKAEQETGNHGRLAFRLRQSTIAFAPNVRAGPLPSDWTAMRLQLSLLFPALLLAACAQGPLRPDEIALPRHQAWVDGQRVDYVTTDISDAGMAAQQGINHAPRLRDAIGSGQASITERVYKFTADAQISIFPSAPAPAGAAQPDANYSPLWRVVLVTWKPGVAVRELRSEEAVLAAADAGDVQLAVTDIVVNCPIVRAGRR